MKRIEPYTGFEQGPIRPPSEAGSLLIRITRNCPWNFCTFCGVYKGTRFSQRPVEHVLEDIDAVHACTDALLKSNGPRRHLADDLSKRGREQDLQVLHAARHFIENGMKSIFLQDGNSLIIKPEDLVRILRHIKDAFPKVKRVTSYARSHTIARISDKDLLSFADAGLNRIHIGMESGSDAVLKQIRKGTDKKTQISAGLKIKRAGIELSEYYIPGAGGGKLSSDNAKETADALNQINPDFIRLRTLALPDNTPLAKQFKAGQFDKMGEVGTARELMMFLEHLHGINSKVKSDHVLNLFPEIEGKLPEDKMKMIEPVKRFLQLDPHDQMLFCIGRRTYHMSHLSDLQNPVKRGNAEQICTHIGATIDNMDTIVNEIIKQLI